MHDTIHVYVFDGYADWEPAFAVAGIRSPRFQKEPGRWQVRTVAETRNVVRSMGGFAVLPDLRLDELDPRDSRLLILPGGEGWEDERRHGQAVELASEFLDESVTVAAICGATAGLGRAGLLKGRAHTSNAASYLKGSGYDDAQGYVDQPAVNDRGLITAGGMSPIEFAREIFAALDVYEPEALDAWVQLYKTGKPEYFARMERAAEEAAR